VRNQERRQESSIAELRAGQTKWKAESVQAMEAWTGIIES